MATLVRWEPFREIASLQNEMSRFMNGLLEGNGRTNQAWVPALDVWETESEIVYALDLPGIPEDKISVELDDGALTITGERERAPGGNRGPVLPLRAALRHVLADVRRSAGRVRERRACGLQERRPRGACAQAGAAEAQADPGWIRREGHDRGEVLAEVTALPERTHRGRRGRLCYLERRKTSAAARWKPSG